MKSLITIVMSAVVVIVGCLSIDTTALVITRLTSVMVTVGNALGQ